MVKDPDHVVTHHPKTCQGCGCCLENVEPQKTIRRQVFDLSRLRLHVTSNQKFTHYFVHEKRGSQAMEANGLLPSFKGTVIHDHWTPYFKYDECTHALCNVHHLREFKGIIDFENQQWAKDMTE